MKVIIQTIMVLLLTLASLSASAQTTMYEQEPNNKPGTQNQISAPIVILGSMQKNDQDMFSWEVSDVDAGFLWDIELEGIAEKITKIDVMQLTFTADGTGVTKVDKIFSLQSNDGANRVSKPGLIFTPGTYYFGLSYAGGKSTSQTPLVSDHLLSGLDEDLVTENQQLDAIPVEAQNGYQLSITQGRKFDTLNSKNNNKEKPASLRLNRLQGVYFYSEHEWIKFKLSAQNASNIWDIKGNTQVGGRIQVNLFNSQGELLTSTAADQSGQFLLPDLKLAAGEYLVELNSQINAMTSIELSQVSTYVEGNEIEPNDKFKVANQFTLDGGVSGQVGRSNDKDFFVFEINQAVANNQFDITLINHQQTKFNFCLHDENNNQLQCKQDNQDITLPQLNLSPGTYVVSVSQGQINSTYTIEITQSPARKNIMEAEPNDLFSRATAMGQKRIVKGSLRDKDVDFFVFEVGAEPQLWAIQAIGKNLTQIALFDAANTKVQENHYTQGTQRARISNLQLQPGKHFIQLKGENVDYILRAFPTGIDDGSFESEPNNKPANAEYLLFNQSKKGVLDHMQDIDLYRFELKNQQGIQLAFQAPADSRIYYKVKWENEEIGKKISAVGEKLVFQGNFPAGEYQVSVQPYKSMSKDVYQLDFNPINLTACEHDCEPNDNAHQAQFIEASLGLSGEAGTHEDEDWYQLPAYDSQTTVTFVNNQSTFSNELSGYLNFDQKLDAQLSEDKQSLSFVIPAHQASYFRIRKDVKYDFQVLLDNQIVQAPKKYKDMTLTLANLPDKVQAYSNYGQFIQTTITIKNNGLQDQQVSLEAVANDDRWKIVVNDSTETIAIRANDEIKVPIDIHVPSELINKQLIRLNFSVKNKSGLLSNTWHDMLAVTEAPLINPSLYWSIDKRLLGGINVAATSLGSQRTAQDLKINNKSMGKGYDQLFDDVVGDGLGMQFRNDRSAEENFVTIDLAGDEPVAVQGILLNPMSQGQPQGYVKNFDLHLSTDGVNFSSVFTGQLKAINTEQSFVLPQAIPAKYARLYLLSSHLEYGKSAVISLGEWKVIAQPGQQLNHNQGFNLADPELGGHVAWAVPQTSGSWDKNLLTSEKEGVKIQSRTNKEWQWVVGFHHQRAAKIDRIEWLHGQADLNNPRVTPLNHVKIMTSLESNVGPWTTVAEKTFTHLDSKDEIIFQQPIWARYVKFSVGEVATRQTAYLPETIRIIEHQNDQDYRSILGEWGQLSEQAIYELNQGINIATDTQDSNNHSKAKSIDLTTTQTASGQVQLEQSDKPDWYKFKTSASSNTLKINLSGQYTVETIIKVEDAQGNEMPLIIHNNKHNDIEYRIPVIPENEYYIKVEEPPRSVIFAWDTSGSTANYHAKIYQAINNFSNGVIEGRDTVNLLPFGGNLLMQDWYGRPDYIKTILNNYPRTDDSSSAEKYLHDAARALENRPGSKAIIIITDAITNKYQQVWDALKATKPRVFSIGIIRNGFGGNSNRQVDLMQSWSRVNNGDFQQAVSFNQVEKAFERAAVKLRQPANYTLKVNSEYMKEPGPGQLTVSQEATQQSAAVELILDASGSMLKRLDGQRRINIAKEVLINTVTETIPENTPVALRVFGDQQANACRTDLAIKLGPLDRNKAKNVISQINAKNLAKTPIADSLAKVAGDLKSHAGKKIVILVTDGEETCEGNPEEVIDQLIEQGVDIRINIVGFAIDDAALKAQFNQWSEQSGGKYFDSNNSESLKQSISQALKTPFSVFSSSGELVQEGVVNGEPLELPAGIYTVKVYGSDIQTFENYHIKGETAQEIAL